jgi:diguanylate cyclase (GGDEF)-like protein
VNRDDRAATLTVAACGVLVAVFVVFFVGGVGDEQTVHVVTNLVHIPIALAYTVLGLRVVTTDRRTRRARRAWTLISAAFGCRLVAQVSWFAEDVVIGDPRYPSVADYLFLAFVPVMFAGLLLLPASRRTRADLVKLTLDSLIVCAAALMVFWYLWLGPMFVGLDVSVVQVAYAATLPMADLLLVLALAMLLLRRSTATEPAVRLLAGAVAMFIVADTWYGYLQLRQTYAVGEWPDLFWAVGGFLLVLAAHRGRHHETGAPRTASRRGINWVPYSAVALAYGLLGYLARDQGIYPLGGMIIGAILLTTLVVVRQMLVLRENVALAVTDPLTGLANRTLIGRRLAGIAAAPVREDRCSAVMVIDLDRFKPINDAYGHEAGDAVLEAVAGALRSVIRAGDTAGRLGGDEFAVILPDLPGRDVAERIAGRLVEALRTPVVHGDLVLAVEASVGVAVRDADNLVDAERLLHQADLAMYVAKRTGRRRYEFFTDAYDTDARDAELRRAIDNDELVLHYQPIVALDTGDIVSLEALVRWNHPERGLLMPGAFVDLAEETGAVVPMGEWVLREACREAAAWRTTIPGTDELRVNVNLSPQQAMQSDLVDVVERILGETGFPAGRLVLEITEGIALEPDEGVVTRLQELRDRGINISVDDFGTGYSALSYLRRLPVNTLKIDRSFITDIVDDPEARQVAEAVVRLGTAFRMYVVAEGIETAEQARMLAEMGCVFGQGYHFHRPLEPGAVPRVLSPVVPAS